MNRSCITLLGVVALILAALSTTCLAQSAAPPASQHAAQPAEQPRFTFGVITDTHIADAQHLARFRAFLHTIQDRKIDFLLILGDVCGHAPEYLPQIKDVIDHSGLKVYTIPGNHDDNYGRNPEWYSAAFEPSYYSFDHKGWHFVMHNSQNPAPAEWLREHLSTDKPTLFCQHYPPTPGQTVENLPWAELATHPNLKQVLVGHAHRRMTRQIGPVHCEVLKNCFFTGQKDGDFSYYIVQAFSRGQLRLQEFPLTDLALRQPADETPIVAITAPADGDVLRNGTLFRGTARDDIAVRKVEFSLDYGRWQPAEGTEKWKFSLNTTSLPDGHHFVRVRAIDSAGQPSVALADVLTMVENHPPQPGRVFRFQQGVNGYEGCTDVTVRRPETKKAASGEEGESSDLECWVYGQGKQEYNEFYIRFDLSKSGIPRDAKIARATLTLYGSRQNQVDPDGGSRYQIGVMQQPWSEHMTFDTRPARPGWLVQPDPQIKPDLQLSWPSLGGRQMIIPPQPVEIDLTPIKSSLQRWLADPASNHGLVFSPAPGKDYNMSAKGSECPIKTLRPRLEILIEPAGHAQ